MARNRKTTNGDGDVPAGWAEAQMIHSPFWTPWDEEPSEGCQGGTQVEGVVHGFRTLPARGKFAEQDLIDLDCEEGGLTVRLNGNLASLVRGGKVGEGMTVRILYVGKESPSKKRPLGMHTYRLLVQE